MPILFLRSILPLINLFVTTRIAAALVLVASAAFATPPDRRPLAEHWVASWSVSQQLATVAQAYLPTLPSVPPDRNRRELLPQPLIPTPPLEQQTVRMILHTSLGGRSVRVHFSSTFGTPGVWFWDAHIALHDRDSKIIPASDRPLTFGGLKVLKIPPGAEMMSDPVDLVIPSKADLAISFYVNFYSGPVTEHQSALHKTYIAKGDVSAQTELSDAVLSGSYLWLSGIDVLAPESTGTLVAFGDSLTSGISSTQDQNRDWPAVLFSKLTVPRMAVVNQGLAGNRLLRDGPGVSALGRFDRDVLGRSGVAAVLILLGTYDIGFSALEHQDIRPEEIIGSYLQLIERAHSHGLRVIGGTLPPFGGAFFYRKGSETARNEINAWIRKSDKWDGVVDFDAALRDAAAPSKLRSEFDSGDHVTLNDAGYEAMAEAVNQYCHSGSGCGNPTRRMPDR